MIGASLEPLMWDNMHPVMAFVLEAAFLVAMFLICGWIVGAQLGSGEETVRNTEFRNWVVG
jgi:hypothetical protein